MALPARLSVTRIKSAKGDEEAWLQFFVWYRAIQGIWFDVTGLLARGFQQINQKAQLSDDRPAWISLSPPSHQRGPPFIVEWLLYYCSIIGVLAVDANIGRTERKTAGTIWVALSTVYCNVVVWPSGLRRCVKAAISSGAWVRTPPPSHFKTRFSLCDPPFAPFQQSRRSKFDHFWRQASCTRMLTS